jgi:hypothetical protein
MLNSQAVRDVGVQACMTADWPKSYPVAVVQHYLCLCFIKWPAVRLPVVLPAPTTCTPAFQQLEERFVWLASFIDGQRSC